MKKIWSRDESEMGIILVKTRPCRTRECIGIRLTVRWHDGKITHPCSASISINDKGKKIIN